MLIGAEHVEDFPDFLVVLLWANSAVVEVEMATAHAKGHDARDNDHLRQLSGQVFH